jgi:hypothetical protein
MTVIYTAIFGGMDVLRLPRAVEAGASYICFTDNPALRSDVWDVEQRVPRHEDPCRAAKYYKVVAHKVLACGKSIWIDGNIEILRPLLPLFDEFTDGIGLFAHPRRDCPYDEAQICVRLRKDSREAIDRSIEQLRTAGHPIKAGLYCGGFLLRRHTRSVARFNATWWEAIVAGSRRDQITLPWALQVSGVGYHVFPGRKLRSCFRRCPHLRRRPEK